MSNDVLVLAEHDGGEVAEVTYELIGKARELAAAWGGRSHVAILAAPGVEAPFDGADVVHVVAHPALAAYSPEAYERTLVSLLAHVAPRLLLVATTTVGMDLGAALSVLWDAQLAAYVVGLAAEGSGALATCQIYGGKLMAEVDLDAERTIATVIGGSFPGSAGKGGASGTTCVDEPPALEDLRVVVRGLRAPEATGVDITAADMLVSVGRGIQSKDNLELVEELADVLGVPVL